MDVTARNDAEYGGRIIGGSRSGRLSTTSEKYRCHAVHLGDFFMKTTHIRRAGAENMLSILQIELGALPVFMSPIVMGVHRMVEQMAEKHLFRPWFMAVLYWQRIVKALDGGNLPELMPIIKLANG